MFTLAQARSMVRKAVKRVPEGEEIRHLNIMPMMDMMTILLVAFVAQIAVASNAAMANSVVLPATFGEQPMPETSALLIITKTAIVVEGEEIVAVRNGDVDPSQKEGGADGRKIPRLSNFLGTLRSLQDQALQKQGKPIAAVPELMIVADRSIPYGLLINVMFSAKQKEAGFKRFRLIVQKSHAVGQ
ncbi:MAG: biopolymer transporter ExbD [Myxococcales bacterium]|nr:biopolymer transporter ExbD [Myxococcales bacterium]